MHARYKYLLEQMMSWAISAQEKKELDQIQYEK